MGLDTMIFVFWMLSFKPDYSLSSFTLIKRLFSSSSLSAIRCSVQSSHSVMSDSFDLMDCSRPGFPVHHQLPELAQNSCPSSQSNHLILCHPLLLLPSIFPSTRIFPVSQFFTSGGQSIGASASASVLPMTIQDWFPLGLTGLISLQSKGLSRVFSNATVQMHQFFGAQLSLWSNSHNHMWLLEKP